MTNPTLVFGVTSQSRLWREAWWCCIVVVVVGVDDVHLRLVQLFFWLEWERALSRDTYIHVHQFVTENGAPCVR